MILHERDVVARVERVTLQRLRVWVKRGWIRPLRKGRAAQFTEADVARVGLICDLSDTLEIHEEAVPVILHLIDQIHGLRHEMKALLEAIDALPEDTRAQIRARIKQP
jgi:chaperone modulatory protein CbpM